MYRTVKGRSSGPAKELLRARWSRWTAIVEAFALRRPSRRRVAPTAYQALRRELIDACRSVADPADGVTPAYAEALEGLVLPWLSPKTLGQADPEILRGLLARCRQVERELGGRGARLPASFGRGIESLTSVATRIAGAVVLALALIGLVSILRAAGFNPTTTLDRAAGWADLIRLAATRSSDVERFGALALLVVPASILLIRRMARS